MKKSIYITAIFILLITRIGNAQETDYLINDSLIEKLNTEDKKYLDSVLTIFETTKIDTSKLNILQEIIPSVSNIEVKKAYNRIFYETNKKLYANGSKSLREEDYNYFIATYYANIGEAFFLIELNDSAIIFYHKSEKILENMNKPYTLGSVYNNLAYGYAEVHNIKKSIYYAEKGIEVLKKIKSYESLAVGIINLGYTHINLDENEKALEYFEEGYEYAKKSGNKRYESYAIRSLAKYYHDTKQYKKSEEACYTSIKLLENTNSRSDLISTYVLLAEASFFFKEYEKSNEYALKTLELSNEFNDPHGKALALSRLSQTILNKQNNPNKAKKHALKAFSIVDGTDDYSTIKIVADLLSDIYAEEKNYKKAYQFKNIYINYKDSLANESKRAEIIKQGIRYNYQKQKEIDDIEAQKKLELVKKEKQLVESEKKRSNTLLIAALLIGLLILAATFIIYNRLKIIKKQKIQLDGAFQQLEESKKNELIVSNLKALQSQMNPHFIFNALNSVQDLVLLKDVRNSNMFLGKFSDLIRKILTSSRTQFISLEEELEILSLYLDLEKLRFGDEFVIKFNCEIDEISQMNIKIPAMFIQPYIENAIKHGLFNMEGIKKLRVEFTLEDSYLKCEIEDNGVGQEMAEKFKQKNLQTHTGFSTESINQRIYLLNQTMDKEIKYTIKDLKNGDIAIGTKVTLQFPI